MDKRRYDPGVWNFVAVARVGMTGKALEALSRFGSVRSTPYPSVLVGYVATGDTAAWLLGAWSSQPSAFALLTRMVPLEQTLAFERDDVTECLCDALEAAGPRLAGKTFHVRAHLRGMKGRLETHAVERALGGFLLDRALAAGAAASVRFDDPDIVVAVQVLGGQVGYGFLDRQVRGLPLVRPR